MGSDVSDQRYPAAATRLNIHTPAEVVVHASTTIRGYPPPCVYVVHFPVQLMSKCPRAVQILSHLCWRNTHEGELVGILQPWSLKFACRACWDLTQTQSYRLPLRLFYTLPQLQIIPLFSWPATKHLGRLTAHHRQPRGFAFLCTRSVRYIGLQAVQRWLWWCSWFKPFTSTIQSIGTERRPCVRWAHQSAPPPTSSRLKFK